MGRHRAGARRADVPRSARHRATRQTAGRRRAEVRRGPRPLLAVGAVLVTGLVVAAGMGVLPPQATPQVSANGDPAPPAVVEQDGVPRPRVTSGRVRTRTVAPVVRLEVDETALPANSGKGRRVVFSQSAQRVWLVESDGTVARTYPVSGSRYDNLAPGTYSVFSRSEQAWGIDDSGTMRNFVRFAHGPNAAIGFHDIPVKDGRPVQAERQLGTPLSHGCVRQAREDALALWEFAPLGTKVVVV